MSTAQDCAIVSAAFKLSLGSSCCGNGPAVCDASGRVTEIHAGCTQASQWFGGTFPQGLEALPNLRIMFFDNCEMTGPLPDTFGGFSQLFEMHLQGNHFNGPIPPSFAGMISMQYFHIQDNFFIGSIPAGLSSWTILQVGEFQGNCLTGSSPSTKINIGAQKTGCPTSWPPLPAPNPVNNPGPPAVTTSAVATTSATNSNVTTKAVAITTAATSSVATTSTSVPADSQSPTFPLPAIVGGSILLLLILVALGICYCVRIKTKRSRGGGNPHIMLNDDADGIPMRKPQPIPAAPAAMRDADGKFVPIQTNAVSGGYPQEYGQQPQYVGAPRGQAQNQWQNQQTAYGQNYDAPQNPFTDSQPAAQTRGGRPGFPKQQAQYTEQDYGQYGQDGGNGNGSRRRERSAVRRVVVNHEQ